MGGVAGSIDGGFSVRRGFFLVWCVDRSGLGRGLGMASVWVGLVVFLFAGICLLLWVGSFRGWRSRVRFKCL